MSGEDSDVKRRCVENDHSPSNPSTSTAPTNSQLCSGAPIKTFRDLVFSVSGTMPAVEKSETEQNSHPFSGKRKLGHSLDDNSGADADACNESQDAETKEGVSGIVNESDVGITEYISGHDGFSGILKQR